MRGGVFVCHAARDAGTAQRVVAALEAAGLEVRPDASPAAAKAFLDGERARLLPIIRTAGLQQQ